MPAQTHLFRCLQDNFGVLEAALKDTGWKLTDILVTHHHGDHTGGIVALKDKHRCKVTAPRAEAARIPEVDVQVGEGDKVAVGGLTARVLETPGHTAGHITYVFDADKLMFAGDTLFSIGCGRVIEGSMPMMWESLLKLRALPDDVRVFCGHEYTAANIRFAKTIEPDNRDLAAREQEVTKLLAAGKPTVPSLLGDEKRQNVFLRADVPAVAAAVGLAGRPAAEVFAEVRTRKNKF
jgi:hydroxyacylglutathione hydrolase